MDALYIVLRNVQHDRGQQITPGMVLSYDSSREIAAIEVLDASKRVDGEPLAVAFELLASEAVPASR